MTCLNEAELSKNIGKRYVKGDYMTYIGPTLIVINPFAFIRRFFGDEIKKDYMLAAYGINKNKNQPPHNYAIASRCYAALFEKQKK